MIYYVKNNRKANDCKNVYYIGDGYREKIVDFACIADYKDGTMLSDILQRQKQKGEITEEEFTL